MLLSQRITRHAMTCLWLGCLLSGLGSWLPSTQVIARQQGSRQLAKHLYLQGKALAKQKQYGAATQKFLAAFSILERLRTQTHSAALRAKLTRGRATLLYIIGRTFHLDGKLWKAKLYYERCLQAQPMPKVKLQAHRWLQEVSRQLRVLLGQQAEISIFVHPSHASISLFNEKGEGRFGRVPFTARVKAGAYQLEIVAAGFQTHREKLYLSPGTRITRRFRLKLRGQIPRRPSPRRRVALRPPPPRPPSLKIQKQQVRRALLWTGVGIAGTTALIGLIMAGLSSENYAAAQKLQTLPTRPSSAQNRDFYQLAEQGSIYMTGAVILFSLTVVSGGGAVIGWWALKPTKPTSPSQATPNRR